MQILFPEVTKFNAYHIHGMDSERVYAALSPVTDGTYSVSFNTINY